MTKYWLSPPPTACDLCKSQITGKFHDAKTIYGPWAIMCPTCHTTKSHGTIGQEYTLIRQKDESTRWEKTGG